MWTEAVQSRFSVRATAATRDHAQTHTDAGSVRRHQWGASVNDIDLQAINQLRAEHVAGVTAGDLQAVLAGMVEDVVYLPPDQPPVVGMSALEAAMRPYYEQFRNQLVMTPCEIVMAGDWAMEWGMVTAELTPLAAGASIRFDGKYVYIYRRQPNGSWKIQWDIYNANVPSALPTNTREDNI